MWSAVRLVNIYFWRTYNGPFFAFGFPIVYTFLMCSLWDLAGQINTISLVPGCFAITIISLTLISIPITINDLRNSIIFKRIGSSSLKTWMFLTVFVSYYFFIVCVSYVWQAIWIIFILWKNHTGLIAMYKHANYYEVIYAILMIYLFSLFMGFVLLSFCRRNYQVQIIAITIIVISVLLAGLGVPISLIHTHSDSLDPPTTKVVYADPLWYVTSLHYEAWFTKPDSYNNLFGSSIFDTSSEMYGKNYIADQWDNHVILSSLDKSLNLFLSLGLIFIFWIFSLFTFKWNVR